MILQKIGTGIKNFAHNLLNISHFLFNSMLIAGGVILCAFYSAPLLPVLFYGIASAIVGLVAFNAAHKVINFLANMFNSPKTHNASVAETKEVSSKATPIVSSTNKVQTTLENNAVKAKVSDVHTQTEAKSYAQATATKIVPAVAVNEEINPASLSMRK